MKICLLGHSGFIGTNLRVKLEIEHDVILSDFRLDDGAGMAAFFLRHADFDLIIHAAGAVSGSSSSIMHTNLWGTFLLTESLKSLRKPFSVIFLSSGAVYGNVSEDHASLETDPLVPVDFYGLSKKSAEDVLRLSAVMHGFALTVIRLPSTYGPSHAKGVLSRMMADAKASGEIKIFGDGHDLRSFVDVRDVCSVVLRLIGTSWSGTLNVSSDEYFTIEEVAQLVQKYIPSRIAYKDGKNLLKRMVLDNGVMRNVTGLELGFTLENFLQSHRSSEIQLL